MDQTFKFNFEADLSEMNSALSQGATEVEILEKKVSQLERELRGLDKAAAAAEKEIEDLTKEFQRGAITQEQYARGIDEIQTKQRQLAKTSAQTQAQINRYNASIRRLGPAYQAQTINAGKALPVLQEFSRIIEDAPFGIIGVGNNITQLGQAFSVLSRRAGGTTAALRIVGGALAGPGGILVALSSVITILTLFSSRFRGSASQAEDSVSKLRKELEQLLGPIEQLRRISALREDILELQGENTLGVIRNTQALLQLELERVNAKLEEERAKLRIAQLDRDQITKGEALARLAEKAFKFTAAAALLTAKQAGSFAVDVLFGDIIKLIDFINKGLTIDPSVFEASKEEIKAVEDAEKRVKAIEEQRLKIIKDLNIELNKANQIIGAGLLEISSKILAPFLEGGGITDGLKNMAVNFAQLSQVIGDDAEQLAFRVSGAFTDTAKNINNALLQGVLGFADFITKKTEDMRKFVDLTKQLFKDLQNAIKEGLGPALSEFGNTIGRELQRGTEFVAAFGKGFLAAFSSLVSRMADLLIAFGAETLLLGKLEASLANWNPAGKIAAGLAAIALGVALKGAAASAAGAAGGTTSSAGSNFTPNQQFSGSTGGGFSSGSFGGTVVFEIAGTKLIGVIDRTLRSKNKTTADIIG